MKRYVHLCRRKRRLNCRGHAWVCGALVCLLVLAVPGAARCTGSLLWDHPKAAAETNVALSPDGAYLTAGGEDGITVFAVNGTILWSAPVSGEYGVTISSGGISLAVGGGTLNVYAPDGTIAWKWGNGYFVFDVDIDPNSAEIVACVDDCTLRSFNLTDSGEWNISVGEDLYSIARSPEGSYIVCGSENGHVYLFGADQRQLWKYRTSGGMIRDVAISYDGGRIVALSEDEMLYMFSRSGRMLWRRSVGHGTQVAITDDGDRVATGGDMIRVFSGVGDQTWSHATGTRVSGVDLSADGSFLAASDTGHIYLFTLEGTENAVSNQQQPDSTVVCKETLMTERAAVATTPESLSPPAKSGADQAILIAFSLMCLLMMRRWE